MNTDRGALSKPTIESTLSRVTADTVVALRHCHAFAAGGVKPRMLTRVHTLSLAIAAGTLLSAGMLATLAPQAPAATVAFVPVGTPNDGLGGPPPAKPVPTLLSVVDANAQPNRIRLVRDASGVTVTDSAATLTAGANCQALSASQVRCTTPGLDLVEVIGGGGADRIDTSGVEFGLDGEVVAEEYPVTLHGGAGDDTLIGGPGEELFDGGPGRDVVRGGPGADVVSFAGQHAPVHVDLARGFTRSGSQSHDSVTGIEGAIGGSGNDVLRGDRADNELHGGAGDDRLAGRSGDDILEGDVESDYDTEGSADGRDHLDGGAGDDLLRASGDFGTRSDILACGPGHDQLTMLDELDRFSECETNGLDDSSWRVTIPLGPAHIGRRTVSIPLSCSGSRSCLMIAQIIDTKARVMGEFRARRFRPDAPLRRVTIRLNARGRRTLREHQPSLVVVRVTIGLPDGSASGTWSMPVDD
jgi:hypothetical protein